MEGGRLNGGRLIEVLLYSLPPVSQDMRKKCVIYVCLVLSKIVDLKHLYGNYKKETMRIYIKTRYEQTSLSVIAHLT